ncbi:hypothetical protein F3Y22_tig00110987pilonHSYRG00053 [Hibiscus syriacus]|uniref:Retroviral polymerase SH3-like domain-containing protein n=1 Tax=Hibiscus syriacus TaxID=106335 RepID=A0A6A2Z8P0_HIBSY|nr:hypothetical protein F3Y22_tig00110987pilonHSYRG00053 [Hibiscus syriacus]
MVKRQFGIDIKCFRSDNAPELKFTDLFAKLVTRALYFQSRVPIRFWGDCLLTVTYLINRLLSPRFQGMSPYELLFGQCPDYGILKTFGCLCFVSTLKSKRDKFSARALPAIFMGYPSSIKGYKVFVLQTQKFVVSRDVIFHESAFPFHTISLPDKPGLSSNSGQVVQQEFLDQSVQQEIVDQQELVGDLVVQQESLPETVPATAQAAQLPSRSNISAVSEPSFNHQVARTYVWRDAMHKEVQAMETLDTWSVVPLPKGKRPIEYLVIVGEEEGRGNNEHLGNEERGLGIEERDLGIEAREGHVGNLPDQLEQAKQIQGELVWPKHNGLIPAEDKKG